MQTVTYTMVSGKRTKRTVKACITMPMVLTLMENGSTTSNTGTELSTGLMVLTTRGTSLTATSRVKENLILLMEPTTMENLVIMR